MRTFDKAFFVCYNAQCKRERGSAFFSAHEVRIGERNAFFIGEWLAYAN